MKRSHTMAPCATPRFNIIWNYVDSLHSMNDEEDGDTMMTTMNEKQQVQQQQYNGGKDNTTTTTTTSDKNKHNNMEIETITYQDMYQNVKNMNRKRNRYYLDYSDNVPPKYLKIDPSHDSHNLNYHHHQHCNNTAVMDESEWVVIVKK
jgi:hypothetical protein